MRTISPALLAHLQGDTKTIASLWLITRLDNEVFAFTDLDTNILYNGQVYESAGGYTHSQIDMTSDLSTTNLEVTALFDSSSITQASLESGAWDGAQVTCMLCNYLDLTMGVVVLQSGVMGQLTINNGTYTAELRGFAQLMQQEQGDMYSPTCRAALGDARCTVPLGPLTATGSVQSINSPNSWNDSTLTQVGPTSSFIDTNGRRIPTTGPYTIQVVPPTGGAFVSNIAVKDDGGNSWTAVGGTPGSDQYNVSGTGLYTFDGTDNPGAQVFIDFNYDIGYFAYGKVKWLTGQNAGFIMEVKQFSPGVVTIAMDMPYPIAVGDTYQIVAGCDKQPGTCQDRFANLVNFRGEPFIPGPDILLAPQGN